MTEAGNRKAEIERDTFRSVPVPEAEVGATWSGNCITLKMVTEKTFGITKIGARILLIVGGYEVTRNLSEPIDQTMMHIDVYAYYF